MALINFSLPIIPSFTKTEPDKLIDVKMWDGTFTQQLLFIPDIKILSNFFKGEVGIADGIVKKMIMSNISKIANPQTLETFLKSTGGKLAKPLENYLKDGRLSINPADLSLADIPGNLGGLKALEKSLIQSIFETKKPYIEIIKLVLENLVKIEDIIARVLAVSGSSMNPKNNPKALGYKGNTAFLEKVAQLDAFKNAKSDPKPITEQEDSTPEEITEKPENTVTQSVFFSTGNFDPTAEYRYIYQVTKPEPEIGQGTFSIPPLSDDDHLPEFLVFGVFDSNFNLVDEKLITTPYQEAKIDGTIDKNINWINRSGKWIGRFDQLESNEYSIKGNYFREGPTADVDGETKFLKQGMKRVTINTATEQLYRDFYGEETSRRAEKKGLSGSTVQEITTEIINRLTTKDSTGANAIQSTIETAIDNSFLTTLDGSIGNISNPPGSLFKIKKPFKPKKVTFKNKEIWIDAESKYDMKIIKCDSSPNITFLDIEPDNSKLKTTKIVRFVKNTLSIRMIDDSEFFYEIKDRVNVPIPRAGYTREVVIDNTRGAGIFGQPSFSGRVEGAINVYKKFMDPVYENGLIFELGRQNSLTTVGGGTYRLYRFNQTWKIERIYWSINSTTREGDIISLGLFQLKTEEDEAGGKRIRIRFSNGVDYFFTTTDGQFIYRTVYKDVNISDIQPENLQRAQVIINNTESTLEYFPLPANSIRVEDDRFRFGKLISNTQILNDQLAQYKPLSAGKYGTPITIKNNNGSRKNLSVQTIEQIYRFQQTEDDTETYFIIEGILSTKNKQKLNGSANPAKESEGNSDTLGNNDYSFPDVIGVIPVFIEMLIDVFAKLIPNINSLISLISNPPKFITDIIIAKIGDNNGTEPEKFGIFSKKFFNDLKKLAGTLASETAKANTSDLSNLFSNALSSLQGNLGSLTSNLTGSLSASLDSASGLLGNAASNFLNASQGIFSGENINLSGTFNNIQSNLSGLVGNIGQTSFNTLTKSFGSVGQDALGNLTSTFNNFAGNALGSFDLNSIGNSFGNLTTNLTGSLNNLQLGNLSNIGSSFADIKSQFGDINNLTSGLSGVFNQFENQFGDLRPNFSNILNNQFGNISSGLSSTLNNLTGQFGNRFNNLQSQFGNITGSFGINNLTGQLGNTFNNLQSQFSDVTGALGINNLQGQFSSIVSNLNLPVDNIAQNFGGNFNNISSTLTNFGESGLSNFSNVFGDVTKSTFGSLTETLGSFTSQLGGIQGSIMNFANVSGIAQNTLGSLTSNLTGVFNNISVVSNLNPPSLDSITKMFNLPTPSFSNITEDIKSSFGNIVSTGNTSLGNFTSNLSGALNKALSTAQDSLSGAFPKDFGNRISNLSGNVANIANNLKSSAGRILSGAERDLEKKKQQIREKLKSFVKNSKLNNYVLITPDGFPKFILDGVSTIKLFGDAPMLEKLPSLGFGLETKLTNLALGGIAAPEFNISSLNIVSKASKLFSQLTGTSKALGQSVNTALSSVKDASNNISSTVNNAVSNISSLLPFNLIFQNFSAFSDKTLSELSGLVKPDKLKIPSALSNFNFEPILDIPNQISQQLDPSKFMYQVANVQYLTGQKFEGVNYKYTYIYEEIQKQVLEAQKLDEAGETTKAVAILEDVLKKEPDNSIINELVDELKKKVSSSVQPIVKFLLEIVSLPLKTIFGIISYIMDVFKSFLNPFELVGKVVNFVSFKWMLDFFNPTSKNSIFSMLGMKFDIETYFTSFIPTMLAEREIFNKLKNGSTEVLGKIGNLANLKNITDNLVNLDTNLINSAQNLLGGITGNLPNVTNNLTNALNGLTSNLSGSLGDLTGNLTGAISNSTSGLTTTLQGLGSNITSTLTNSLQGVGGNLLSSLQGVLPASNIAGNLTNFTSNLSSTLSTSVQNLVGNLSNNVSSQAQNLNQLLPTSFNPDLQKSVNNLIPQFNITPGSILSFGNEFKGILTDGLPNVNAITDNFGKSLNNIEVVSNLNKNFDLESILNSSESTLNNLSSGLSQNINASLGGLTSNLSQVGGNVLGGFRDSLGNITSNLPNPTDLLGKVTDSFGKVSGNLTDSLSGVINFGEGSINNISSNLRNAFDQTAGSVEKSFFSLGSKFDMGKIISMPFFAGKLPTFNLEQFSFLYDVNKGIGLMGKRAVPSKFKDTFQDRFSELQSKFGDLQSRFGNLTSNLSGTINNLESQYGDTLTNLEKQFADLPNPFNSRIEDFRGQFGSAVSNLSNRFGGLTSNLSDSFDNLSGQFGNITAGFGNTFNNFQSQFGNLTSGLSGTFNNLTGQFGNVTSGLSGNFENLTSQFGNITSGLSGTFNNFTSGFGNTFNNLQGQFGNITSGLGNTFNSLQGQFGNITSQFGNITSNLSGSLGNFTNQFSSITGGFGNTFNSLQGQFGNITSGFSNTFASFQGQFSSIASNLNAPLDSLQGQFTNITSNFGGSIGNLTSQFSGNFGNLQSQFSNLTSNFPDTLNSLTNQFGSITSAFNLNQGSVVNIGNDLIGNLSNQLLSTQDIFSNVTSNLSGALKSVNVVSNLNPILNQISLDNLPNLANNLVGDLSGTIKSSFGNIKSDLGATINSLSQTALPSNVTKTFENFVGSLKNSISVSPSLGNTVNSVLNSLKSSIGDISSNLLGGDIPFGLFPKLNIPSLPVSILSSILCLIEAIINSIIDLIWGILGLGSLIPTPHIKICRDSNQNADVSDIAKLLSGAFDDPSKETPSTNGPSYNFVYNIKTSDGSEVRSLNREELAKYLEDNKDLQVDFG